MCHHRQSGIITALIYPRPIPRTYPDYAAVLFDDFSALAFASVLDHRLRCMPEPWQVTQPEIISQYLFGWSALGHNYIGRYYIGHDYKGHYCIGHDYKGHYYIEPYCTGLRLVGSE